MRARANLAQEQQHSDRLQRATAAPLVKLLLAVELPQLLADGGGNNAGAARSDGPNPSPNVRLMPTYELYLLAAAASSAVTTALRLSLVGLDAARQLQGSITTRERTNLLQAYSTVPSPEVLCTKEGCFGYLQQLTNGPRRTATGVVEASSCMLDVFVRLRTLLFVLLAHPTSNAGEDRAEAAARTARNIVVLSDVLLALHAGLQLSQPPADGGSASNSSASQAEMRGPRAGTSLAQEQCVPPPTKRLAGLVY
jgi:hypothetical protein